MKILITGATGFLGKYLVSHLQNDDHEITVVGREYAKLNNSFDATIAKIETDYSLGSLAPIIREQDVVIHLASKLMQKDTHPLKLSCFFENLQMTENLLLACNESSALKFIHTSSISTYNNQQVNKEITSCTPSNIYGVSKACCDVYANYFSSKTSLQILNLRLARLYGAGEREGLLMTDFINQANQKNKLFVHGRGSATIEYVYVKDVVNAIAKAIHSSAEGTINIGTGKALSIKNIAETVNTVFNNTDNLEFITDKSDADKGSVMDIQKAKELLDWQPSWSLNAGLEDTKRIMRSVDNV